MSFDRKSYADDIEELELKFAREDAFGAQFQVLQVEPESQPYAHLNDNDVSIQTIGDFFYDYENDKISELLTKLILVQYSMSKHYFKQRKEIFTKLNIESGTKKVHFGPVHTVHTLFSKTTIIGMMETLFERRNIPITPDVVQDMKTVVGDVISKRLQSKYESNVRKDRLKAKNKKMLNEDLIIGENCDLVFRNSGNYKIECPMLETFFKGYGESVSMADGRKFCGLTDKFSCTKKVDLARLKEDAENKDSLYHELAKKMLNHFCAEKGKTPFCGAYYTPRKASEQNYVNKTILGRYQDWPHTCENKTCCNKGATIANSYLIKVTQLFFEIKIDHFIDVFMRVRNTTN